MPEALPEFDKKASAASPADSDGTANARDPQEDGRFEEPAIPAAAPTDAPHAATDDATEVELGEESRTGRGDVSAADEGPDPWKSADSPGDHYADAYHAGVTGSGSGHAEREPAASTGEAESAEAVGPDGTGLAGVMRRWAVARSADAAGRRAALGLADHVEAVETRLGGVLGGPLRDRGLDGLARRVERNPFATIAGAVFAGWIVNRMLD